MLYALKPDLDAHRLLVREAHFAIGQIATAACQGTARDTTVAESMARGALAWVNALVLEGPVGRCWSGEQTKLVGEVADWIAPTDGTRSQEIKRQLASDARAKPWRNLLWAASGWVLFWTVMLAFFPTSRKVQGAILYQPWARKYLSLGVVPVLLVLVPPLRRRVLLPFRDDLLGDAQLKDMEKLGFYGGGAARRGGADFGGTGARPGRWRVNPAGRGGTRQVERAAVGGGAVPGPGRFPARPRLQGWRCGGDHPPDEERAGCRICPVGDPRRGDDSDHRRTERGFGGRARDRAELRNRQPEGADPDWDTAIEWTPPSGAKVIDLLRFSKEQAEEFLLSRPVGSDAGQRVHGEAYAAAVLAFLRRAFNEAPTEADREAAELMLSNPFDLTFAAGLIAQAVPLTPRGIVDEAFRLAEEGPGDHAYQPATGRPFPLEAFGKHAMEMRLEDRNWLKEGEFEAERPCLIERKLIVARAVRVGREETAQREIFRHDRVWDFFIVAAFRADPNLLEEYLDDARFRGACQCRGKNP